MNCETCGKDVDNITKHNKQFHEAMETYDYEDSIEDLWYESSQDERMGYLVQAGATDAPYLVGLSWRDLPTTTQQKVLELATDEADSTNEGFNEKGDYEEKCDKCNAKFDNPADAGNHASVHEAKAKEIGLAITNAIAKTTQPLADKIDQTFEAITEDLNDLLGGDPADDFQGDANESLSQDLDEILDRYEEDGGAPEDVEEVYNELVGKGYSPQAVKDELSHNGADTSGLESYDIEFKANEWEGVDVPNDEIDDLLDYNKKMKKKHDAFGTDSTGEAKANENELDLCPICQDGMKCQNLMSHGRNWNTTNNWSTNGINPDAVEAKANEDHDLKKRISKLEQFLNVASVENPMNLGAQKQELQDLKNELASIQGQEAESETINAKADVEHARRQMMKDKDNYEGLDWQKGKEADNYKQKDGGTPEDWMKELDDLKNDYSSEGDDNVETGWIKPYYTDGWLGKKPDETSAPDTDKPKTNKQDKSDIPSNDLYGENWDFRSYLNKVESFESIGFSQGDACKLAEVSWYDISKEVQKALEVEDEEQRKQDITDAFNNEGDQPDTQIDDLDKIDYNIIKPNPLSKEKYQCEFCTSGFKSNEYLMTHFNDIHARADEYYIDVPNSCSFCSEPLGENETMSEHLAYSHGLAPNSGLDTPQGYESSLSNGDDLEDARADMKVKIDTLNDMGDYNPNDSDSAKNAGWAYQQGQENHGLANEMIGDCPKCGREIDNEKDDKCPTCGANVYGNENLKKKFGKEAKIVRGDGSITIGGQSVIKMWESFQGWYWYAVEDQGEYETIDDKRAHAWYGYVQGSYNEWGTWDSIELEKAGVWTVPKSNWAWSGKSEEAVGGKCDKCGRSQYGSNCPWCDKGDEAKANEENDLECPECNSTKIYKNKDKGDSRFGQGDYACNNCGKTFNGESRANENEKDEARLWWNSKPTYEREQISRSQGGTMGDGNDEFDWLADGGQFDVVKLFNEQVLGKQGISTGWGDDDVNTVDLTRRSGLFDNDYYTKDSDGRSHEAKAKEYMQDEWWWKHVKWESGMDQDFLYCNTCGRDLYAEASYVEPLNNIGDDKMSRVVPNHLSQHGITPPVVTFAGMTESKATEAGWWECDDCSYMAFNQKDADKHEHSMKHADFGTVMPYSTANPITTEKKSKANEVEGVFINLFKINENEWTLGIKNNMYTLDDRRGKYLIETYNLKGNNGEHRGRVPSDAVSQWYSGECSNCPSKEALYGYGSATGRMPPAESWNQQYLGGDVFSGGRKVDPEARAIMREFEGLQWSELPTDIQELWKSLGEYIPSGEANEATSDFPCETCGGDGDVDDHVCYDCGGSGKHEYLEPSNESKAKAKEDWYDDESGNVSSVMKYKLVYLNGMDYGYQTNSLKDANSVVDEWNNTFRGEPIKIVNQTYESKANEGTKEIWNDILNDPSQYFEDQFVDSGVDSQYFSYKYEDLPSDVKRLADTYLMGSAKGQGMNTDTNDYMNTAGGYDNLFAQTATTQESVQNPRDVLDGYIDGIMDTDGGTFYDWQTYAQNKGLSQQEIDAEWDDWGLESMQHTNLSDKEMRDLGMGFRDASLRKEYGNWGESKAQEGKTTCADEGAHDPKNNTDNDVCLKCGQAINKQADGNYKSLADGVHFGNEGENDLEEEDFPWFGHNMYGADGEEVKAKEGQGGTWGRTNYMLNPEHTDETQCIICGRTTSDHSNPNTDYRGLHGTSPPTDHYFQGGNMGGSDDKYDFESLANESTKCFACDREYETKQDLYDHMNADHQHSKAKEDDPNFKEDTDYQGFNNGEQTEPSQYTQSGMDHDDTDRGDTDFDALERKAKEDYSQYETNDIFPNDPAGDEWREQGYLTDDNYNMSTQDMNKLYVDTMKEHIGYYFDRDTDLNYIEELLNGWNTNTAMFDLPHSKGNTPEAQHAFNMAHQEVKNWLRQQKQSQHATYPSPSWESRASEDGAYSGKKEGVDQWSVMTVGSDLYYFDTEEEARNYVKNWNTGDYDIHPPRG